jgi:hypothetical protein
MARITKELISEKDLTIFTIEGSASHLEMLETVEKLTAADLTSKIVWDATRGTVGGMDFQDIKFIAESLRSGHGMRPDGRTALVAGTVVDYGMARMFATYASVKGLSVKYKCFRNLDEALEWINKV